MQYYPGMQLLSIYSVVQQASLIQYLLMFSMYQINFVDVLHSVFFYDPPEHPLHDLLWSVFRVHCPWESPPSLKEETCRAGPGYRRPIGLHLLEVGAKLHFFFLFEGFHNITDFHT